MHTGRLSRRAALQLGAASSLGLTVTGCRGLTRDAGAGVDELNFFWYVEGKRAQHTLQIARRYEQQNEGITIAARHTGYGEYWDKLATEIAGGNPPDVFQLELARLREYASRGSVRRLDDLMPGLIEKLEPEVAATCRFEDGFYFIPTGLSTTPALIYNVTALDRFGVDVPANDWDQDGFATFCADVWEASGQEVHGTSDLGGSHWALQAFGRTRGEDAFDEEGTLRLSRSTVEDWFAWWEKLRKNKACVPIQRSAEGGGFENFPLITGESVISSTASAKGMLGLQPLTDDELGLVSFPYAERGGPPGTMAPPIEWWAISSETSEEKAQLAADFCSFALTDPAGLDGMVIEHGIPVVPGLRQQAEEAAPAGVKTTFEAFQAVRKTDPEPIAPQPPGAGELLTQVLSKLNEDVGFGRASVAEAVDTFFSEADRVLA